MTVSDLNRCWQRNFKVLHINWGCVHDVIAEVACNQPDSIAVSAWDREVTYEQLHRLSGIIACHLIDIGVKREMMIPLCFPKRSESRCRWAFTRSSVANITPGDDDIASSA